MIRHIVFWRLKGDSPEEKAKLAAEIKTALESLNGKIPGMTFLQVGFDFGKTPESSDVALYSEFVSREALDAYQQHPEHVKIMPFIRESRIERRVVDFEA
jgi:hypothetical protein